MNGIGAALVVIGLAGCMDRSAYSAYCDGNRPLLSRVASLDARLCFLLGDSNPDSNRVFRVLDTVKSTYSALGADASLGPQDRISRSLAAIGLLPTQSPSDSDLVPSLAWRRRRAGCVPLVLLWTQLLNASGASADPVFLPGHLTVSLGASRLIEPLRFGMPREPAFYYSTFHLDARPYYARFRPDSNAVLASMLVQAGLLEWRQGKPAMAKCAFRAAVILCPGLPEAEGNLGLVSEELGDRHDAVSHLQSALRGDRLAVAAKAHLDRLRSERTVQ